MQVVEHEHERSREGKALEELAHRAVRAVALVLECHLPSGGERGERGEDVGELRLHVVGERVEPFRVESLHVLVQSVHEDRKRKVALELRGRSREHEMSPRFRARGELREQAGLADPRLADQLDRRGTARVQLVERVVERAELLGAPYELVSQQAHFPCH